MLEKPHVVDPVLPRALGRVLRLVTADSRHPGTQARPVRRGTPHSADEWTALVKVGSGESEIPAREKARLLELGLIVTVSGRPALTRHGRYTLGLPT